MNYLANMIVLCLNSCLTHIAAFINYYHPLKMSLCNSAQGDTNLFSQTVIPICIKPPSSIVVYLIMYKFRLYIAVFLCFYDIVNVFVVYQ
jgi:hypothetical protein